MRKAIIILACIAVLVGMFDMATRREPEDARTESIVSSAKTEIITED